MGSSSLSSESSSAMLVLPELCLWSMIPFPWQLHSSKSSMLVSFP